MFWGLVLEPSKKYTQKVAQTFHISQAALDLKSSCQEPVQLVVEYENSNFVLGTLSRKANIFQIPLDLIFKAGDQVSFRTIGNGKVHLSGYHVVDDLDSVLMKGEEESDYEEDMEVEQKIKKRKKSNVNVENSKKAKLDETNEDESEDSSGGALHKKSKNKKKKGKSSLTNLDEGSDSELKDDFLEMDEEDDDDNNDDGLEDEQDEEDEDYENEDEDEDLGEEENEDEELDNEEFESDDDDDLEFESDDDFDEDDFDTSMGKMAGKKEKVKTPKSETKKTPNGTAFKSKEKVSSTPKLNKSKSENKKETPNNEGKAKNEKKGDKSNKAVDTEKTPVKKNLDDSKEGDKTPKTPKAGVVGEKKVLEGGVICEEIKIGTGPVAKPGKMVNVYYSGSLQSTKKHFDSVQSGPGFKFRLGKNEVIKGWDIGLNGMKVGGTRKLTIPPYLAYGTKGSPPVIPPNSTLVFTVELKGIS